ncbi:hypothetical protein BD626DRAFT_413603 [Schizophyllum amplum]|uniref:C2H2-type domain-containing protein n=1 Tax=Schizophyllum amplum TaxID=97359 RepID=A0A550BVM9_9AGAR|nr:hypothetical protein BD626DRAFT_413603 [Auriculariopsis ampla]
MSRSVAVIWRNSLASVPYLPPVPDDMNEPQYINFFWGKQCSYCDSKKDVTQFWIARVRYCKKCRDKCAIYHDPDMHDFNGRLRRIVSYEGALAKVVPSVHIQVWCGYDLFPVDLVKRYSKELERLGVADGKPETVAKQWTSNKRAQLIAAHEHARLCEEWFQRQEDVRKAEIERKRDCREQAIVQRLTDLGWGDEISYLHQDALGKQPSVRLVQPLSKTGWLEIKDNLTAFMERSREKRLAKQRAHAIQSRHHLLARVYPEFRRTKPFRAILPSIGDITKIETFQHAILDLPFDQEMSDRALLDVLKTIPQAVFDDWQTRTTQKVLDFVRQRLKADQSARDDLGTDTPTLNTLKLATAIFWDGTGGHDLRFPTVLVWPELSGALYGHMDTPWSTRELRFGGIGSTLARRMVELVGRNPHEMTSEEMDELDPWYHFPGEHDSGRMAYSWRCVPFNYRAGREDRLTLLDPEDTATARARFASKACTLKFRGRDALCAHCKERFSESEALYGHLRGTHAVDPVTLTDFVPGLDIDYASTMCVVLPSEATP